ncbi:MAG: hypothetical protein WC606_04010 [Candidatus Absconditabacterales bacterium]|jgi:hypothetical protein
METYDLKQIYWSDGNFVDENKKPIIGTIIPIGKSDLFSGCDKSVDHTDTKIVIYDENKSIENYLQEKTEQDKSYHEVNAYVKGRHTSYLSNPRDYAIAVSFFKIVKE